MKQQTNGNKMIVKVKDGERLYNALSYDQNGEIITTPLIVKDDEPFFGFIKRVFYARKNEVQNVV